LVTGTKIIDEVGRNLAVVQALDRQSEQFILGRRSYRIAALRLVICGVGPAERTGKSVVTYCPGGTRFFGVCS
jgi:hypothetical protein